MFVIVAVLGIGFFMGWLANRTMQSHSDPSSNQVRANLPQYKYVNPLLFSDNTKSSDAQIQALADSVSSFIDNAVNRGQATSASVYFRDLNSARWTGINEDELYTPSSMLKVIAMMAALKVAESNPAVLGEKFTYTRTDQNSRHFFDTGHTVPSGMYTLQDLIGIMIKYSDNDAFDAIVGDSRINKEFVQIYSIFRLPETALAGNTQDFMSPKSFSSVFRALYNSSIFQWDLSEQVLSLLTQTTFTQGLVAGVPAGTPVAHKYGENTDELHDCGIVYYPNHPYLLCIMTRGSDLTKLESVISGISSTVWNFVDKGTLTQGHK